MSLVTSLVFTDKECPDPPTSKVGFLIGGSETVYEAELPYREDYRVSERRMKFLSPLPSGDFKIMSELSKTVSGGSPFTATGYITLPDLRIDRPLEVGCFKLPESFDSSHTAVANLNHEGEGYSSEYFCLIWSLSECVMKCHDDSLRVALLHNVSISRPRLCVVTSLLLTGS